MTAVRTAIPTTANSMWDSGGGSTSSQSWGAKGIVRRIATGPGGKAGDGLQLLRSLSPTN